MGRRENERMPSAEEQLRLIAAYSERNHVKVLKINGVWVIHRSKHWSLIIPRRKEDARGRDVY
jgi:hypothetical protein